MNCLFTIIKKRLEVAKTLIDEHYVVLLSYEENLLIVNWEYSPESDRNDVVFMGREEFEEEYVEVMEE